MIIILLSEGELGKSSVAIGAKRNKVGPALDAESSHNGRGPCNLLSYYQLLLFLNSSPLWTKICQLLYYKTLPRSQFDTVNLQDTQLKSDIGFLFFQVFTCAIYLILLLSTFYFLCTVLCKGYTSVKKNKLKSGEKKSMRS